MSAPDDDDDWRTPVAGAVARRALVQCAVVCRGSLDGQSSHPGVATTLARLDDWLAGLGLLTDLEPIESAILNAPRGVLSPRQVVDSTWAAEGLAVLAWALGRYELPPYDQKVDPFALAESVGFLDPEDDSLIAHACLREPRALQACRELQYAVHVRLAQFRRGRSRMDFRGWVEPEWVDATGATGLIVAGDLGIGGRSIGEADPDLVRDAEWIAQRRHAASIWLVGEYPIYTETPADT